MISPARQMAHVIPADLKPLIIFLAPSAYVCTTRQSTLHAMVKLFLIGEQF